MAAFLKYEFDKGECTFCQKCVLVCEQPIFHSLEEEPWAYKVEITTQCQQKIEWNVEVAKIAVR